MDMGGKILEHAAKTIRNEGIEEGRKEGRKEGQKIGIQAFIKLAKKLNIDYNEIVDEIVKEFKVSEEYAKTFLKRTLEFEKNYHLECQSKVDGSIMIRMYEYDSQIARNNYELYDETLFVNFPMSAIIYLRSYNNTTDMLKICIKTSDGNQIHNIPILKIRNYDIESIFCKRLLFLIPFYIFNYESELNIFDNNVKKYEELMNTYKKIVNGLDSLHEQAFIDEYTKITLFELTKMVVNNLADKYKNIKKGVSEIMGGKILDHPAKTIRNEGIEEGRREGILAYINLSKKFNVEDKEIFESIVKEFNVSEDYVREFFMNDF